ncbi:MAG: lipopolysaccharide heptosyltransferase II [Deltaproteobacteria bacterium]|nr:lipopolysaccharide heptosyltransferase II [Deltaproteobacteria bacterium]
MIKILVVKLSAIGDVIHTMPSLNAIRKHYPDAHITWLIEEAASSLVVGHEALDRVIISKRKQWVKEILNPSCLNNIKKVYRFVKELRDTEYDLIIDFQGLLKSAVLIALARGKRKTGFDKGMEHMEHSYIFLNERILPVNMDNHALLRSLMLINALGIKSKEIEYKIPVSNYTRNITDKLLERHGIKNPGILAAINPVAKWKTKLWDNRKFALLADKLIEKYNASLIFTGSQSDRSTIDKIMSCMSQSAVNLTGETTLKNLAALYKKTKFLISTDTGPMHMAAAVGTPVIALFGPTAPCRTGPFGSEHKILRSGLDCSPCFKRQCSTIDCMKQISVEQVMDAVDSILS